MTRRSSGEPGEIDGATGTQMVRQGAFTSGQVDEINWKRSDFQDYMTGAQVLKNAEVGTTGLAKKRLGTQFIANVTPYVTPGSQLYEFTDRYGNFYILMTSALVTSGGVEGTIYVFGLTGTLLQSMPSHFGEFDLATLDYSANGDVVIFVTQRVPPARVF